TVGEADGSIVVSVGLSAASEKTITVQYATSNGTATASSDYTAAKIGRASSRGETAKTFAVSIANDTTDEDDETVSLTLSSPSNVSLGSPSAATLTIQDNDDPPTVGVSASGFAVGEAGGSGVISVSLSAASGKTITIQYATSNGTATAGSDYTAA